ncbi:MAG: type III-B CRISPR module RAMP protein Cmr6 [Gammaproteobacteria bacterium]
MLPLYAQIPQDTFEQADTAHSGLLFDKFPDGWNPAENYQTKKNQNDKSKDDKNKDDDLKKVFLKRVYEKYRQTTNTHLKPNLDIALDRQRGLVNHLQGESLTATTDWRFITGLGAAHPYETGFIWHRTLSVPYLPGSSVKGLMRAFATHWDSLSGPDIDRLFGPKDGDANCGALIVFDALPSKPPALDIDILNPHYSEYYRDSTKPPADYLSPIPVFFLTVAPGQDFEFFLAPRFGASEQSTIDLQKGVELLLKALETIGAGGKTAVGYGAFKESKKAQQKREDEQDKKKQQMQGDLRNAALDKIVVVKGYTGLAEGIYRQAQLESWEVSDNTPKFYQAMPDFLQEIAEESDLKIKQNAIDIISEILEGKFPGILQEPEKKVGKNKGKFAYKDKPKEIAIKLLALIVNVTK